MAEHEEKKMTPEERKQLIESFQKAMSCLADDSLPGEDRRISEGLARQATKKAKEQQDE